MKELLIFLAVCVGIPLALIFGVAIPVVRYDCVKLGQNTGYRTEYHFFGGECLIDIDGRMIPTAIWINNTGN
jgi:hypothetical protein